jgi:hypothetical protein
MRQGSGAILLGNQSTLHQVVVCSSCRIASFTGGWPDPSRGFCQLASYVFTQLIQQPGVGRWNLIRVSGVHRVRDRHRPALAWMAMYHRDTPIEDMPRYSACTTLCHHLQEYGGFATSSSSLCADHRLLKGRFPVTIYNTRCQPNMH